MIQITLSVVTSNSTPLTPHGANLYCNEIFIYKAIGNILLKVLFFRMSEEDTNTVLNCQ